MEKKYTFQTFQHPGKPNWKVRGILFDCKKWLVLEDLSKAIDGSMHGNALRGFEDSISRIKHLHIIRRDAALEYVRCRSEIISPHEKSVFETWLTQFVFPHIGDKMDLCIAESVESLKNSQTIITFECPYFSPVRGVDLYGIPWLFAMDIVKTTHDSDRLLPRHLQEVKPNHKRKQSFNYLKSAVRDAWLVDRFGFVNLVQNSPVLGSEMKQVFATWIELDVLDTLSAKYICARARNHGYSIPSTLTKIDSTELKQLQDVISQQSQQIAQLSQIIANQQNPNVAEAVQLFDNLATFFKTKS